MFRRDRGNHLPSKYLPFVGTLQLSLLSQRAADEIEIMRCSTKLASLESMFNRVDQHEHP